MTTVPPGCWPRPANGTLMARTPRQAILAGAFCLVELSGFEPETPCLQSRCSNQLSYSPKVCRPSVPGPALRQTPAQPVMAWLRQCLPGLTHGLLGPVGRGRGPRSPARAPSPPEPGAARSRERPRALDPRRPPGWRAGRPRWPGHGSLRPGAAGRPDGSRSAPRRPGRRRRDGRDWTPLSVDWTTTVSRTSSTPRLSMAWRTRSGAGHPRGTSSAPRIRSTRSCQPSAVRKTLSWRCEMELITQMRTPDPASSSSTSPAPGTGCTPDRCTAPLRDRSKARCAAWARASLPGNSSRSTSMDDMPRARCTRAMPLAKAVVPVTTPCVAMASA